MHPRTTSALAALALLTTACGAPHLATVQHAKADLQGRESTALACIGEPLERRPTDGTAELWRFSSAQPRDAAGRTMLDPAQPAEAHERACIADARVQDGRITAVTTTNRAGWGFGSIKNCSNLLAACAAGS